MSESHPGGAGLDTRLTIVVVTRNRRASLLRTLERLATLEARYPVIVADNGSADGTVAAVAAAFPRVTLIPLERNLGAAARTVAATRARTPYVAFADDDSWWEPGSLSRAVELFDRHPRLGLVAGRVLVGPEQRPDPTCSEMARSPLPAPPGFPGTPVLGFLACAAVVRRSAFLEAGGFHPRLSVGGEEALLACDLARSGWWLSYVPELVCHHFPAPARDTVARTATEARNRLWVAWLRRSPSAAARLTWSAAMASRRHPAARSGLFAALAGLPWVVRERNAVPRWLERQLALLESPRPQARPAASAAHP